MTRNSYSPVTLRVEPHALPAMKAAFAEALTTLRPHLARLREVGYLHEAWLGDEMSEYVRYHYNTYIMGEKESPYAALRAYEQRLQDVHDALDRMEQEYRRTEGDNAALWGRV